MMMMLKWRPPVPLGMAPPPWSVQEEEEAWSDAPPSPKNRSRPEGSPATNALAESLRKKYDADAAALAAERASAQQELQRAAAEREALAAELRKAAEERRKLEERTSLLEQREAQQRLNAENAAKERAEASAALAAKAAAAAAEKAAQAVQPTRMAAINDEVHAAEDELRAARADLVRHADEQPSDSGASSTSSGRRYRDPRFAAAETERIARIMRPVASGGTLVYLGSPDGPLQTRVGRVSRAPSKRSFVSRARSAARASRTFINHCEQACAAVQAGALLPVGARPAGFARAKSSASRPR